MATIAADLAILLDKTMTAILADLALVSAHAMLTVSVAANIAMVLPLAMRAWKADAAVCLRIVPVWAWPYARKLHCTTLYYYLSKKRWSDKSCRRN